MSLGAQLARLHRENGVVGSDSTSDELQQRLKRLQAKGQRRAVAGSGFSDEKLAAHLGGNLIAPGVVRVDERLSLVTRHGVVSLSAIKKSSALPGWKPVDVGRLLFMDTETTGLAGGSGTLAFMLGLGRLEGDDLVLRQYLLTSFAGEAAMLKDCADWLNGDERLVTYNGKSFDLPLLAGRSRMAAVPDSFSGLQHLDLLHPLRRVFRARWSGCGLSTAERKLIGFQRLNDLSGAEAPEAWFDWIRRRDPGRLGGVLKHNRWDLISMVALLPLLSRAYLDPLKWGGELLPVARSWSKAGREDLALGLLENRQSGLSPPGLAELARIHRRHGAWGKACAIWSRLSAAGDVEATEALAKYHEHVARDLPTAYRFSIGLPDGRARSKRCRRLSAKINPGQQTMDLFASAP